MEKWKWIKGYEGIYMVSDLGRVKSKFKILKSRVVSGYRQIGLRKNNKEKQHYVHRLVAEAFISNPDNKPQVNHKNELKQDNRKSNLEWSSGMDNVIYSSGVAVIKMNLEGIELKEYPSISSTEFDGFTATHVCQCCKGRKKTHGGFTWKYKK